MSAIVLILECLTNLHVGNGDSNYNIIDNEVERDPVTNYPTIHSSGVKGALRAFLKNDREKCKQWFGAEGNDGQGGCLKILAANMLAMPARATKGKEAYYLIATEQMRNTFCNLQQNLQFPAPEIEDMPNAHKEERVEEISLNKCMKFAEKEIYLVSEDDFKTIPLPVIARNKLEEGISKNLWYEEVVPHESLFYIPVICEQDQASEALLDEFKNAVNGKVIQFGGNASIGYGLCKVTVGGK